MSFDLDKLHRGGGERLLPEGAQTGDEIDFIFDRVLSIYPGHEFLESIHTWWEEKGFLTEKQYEALLKFNSNIEDF